MKRPISRPLQKPSVQLALLCVAAAVGLVYGYLKMVHAPAQPTLQVLEVRRAALEQANAQVRGSIAAYGLPRLRARILQYQAMRGALDSLIPPSDSLLDVLGVLHRVAQNTGIEVAGVRPDSSTLEGPYAKRGWSITAVGAYEKLGRFLAVLASEPHIARPTHVAMTQALNTDITVPWAADVRAVVKMQFTLETVWNATPLDTLSGTGAFDASGTLPAGNSMPAVASPASGPLPPLALPSGGTLSPRSTPVLAPAPTRALGGYTAGDPSPATTNFLLPPVPPNPTRPPR